MHYGFVYITTNLENNKKYIGKRKLSKGWEKYLGSSKKLKQDIKIYGKDKFKKEIISYADTKEELSILEKKLIEEYDAVNSDMFYNIDKGGSGGEIYKQHPKGYSGHKHTKEWCENHSKFVSNKDNNCMTNGQVIWDVTHEHPRGMLGKHLSDDHKRKISIQVISISPDGEVQEHISLKECSEKLGCNYHLIKECIRTKKPLAFKKGHTKEFKEKNAKFVGYKFYKKENTEVI